MGLLEGLKEETNYTRTWNGDLTHESTLSAVLDLFAFGGSYREHSDADCISLFSKALEENETLALKCLFYLADCRGGQGERRFFRVCCKWLAETYPDIAKRNLVHISEYRRWDDLIYSCLGTPIEEEMLWLVRHQLVEDAETQYPSLLAKWLPSENASSSKTKAAARVIRHYLNLSCKQYRKMLSTLRARINVLERLMSAQEWDKIDFSVIPSVAGMKYMNAFEMNPQLSDRYREFINSKETKVNASVLNPKDIIAKCARLPLYEYNSERAAAIDKYWESLPDYYNGRKENGLCVVDVSGSMWGTPIQAAVGLGMYIAERGEGPFKDHFITFSSHPRLVKIHGQNICEKYREMISEDWGMSTNIEKTMNLILATAVKHSVPKEEMPTRLYIFSDMQFNQASSDSWSIENGTFFEILQKTWSEYGYELPNIIFWNLNADNPSVPAIGGKFSYVSGFSPSMIDTILSGKTGYELMLEKLNSQRYAVIR